MKSLKKILFLTKSHSSYGDYDNGNGYSNKPKAGLYNSAKMTMEALRTVKGLHVNLDTCIDGNDVDNKLVKYNEPRVCIIEAIWITPEKLEELAKLHRKTIFIVRVHSKIPFLAMEGTAISWLKQYNLIPNVYISLNNEQTSNDLIKIGINNIYLPNIYTLFAKPKLNLLDKLVAAMGSVFKKKEVFNIGCFGAIRPMKNHLTQAIAAMRFAENNNAVLNFYVNGTRTEQAGENVLKNLRALFEHTPHRLIELAWHDHVNFLEVVKTMDMSMQVSFSESFNIVTADCVYQNVPVVTSKEISWLPYEADPNDVEDIVSILECVWKYRKLFVKQNKYSLAKYNENALEVWKDFLRP